MIIDILITDGRVPELCLVGIILQKHMSEMILTNMLDTTYSKRKGQRGRTMDQFKIEFYTKDNGEKPAKDFLLSLDIKMRAKLSGILAILETELY